MNVLLVEDDHKTGAFIVRGFTERGHLVRWEKDGPAGAAEARTGRYDVLIIDRMLPGQSGFAIVETLRSEGVGSPILILTALSSVEERVQGLEIGADDYLGKPFAFSELLARVRALHRRGAEAGATEPGHIAVGDLVVDLRNRRVVRAGRRLDLTPQEFRLLEFLVRRVGQTVTRTMLLEGLWGYDFDTRTNIIDAHVSRLRAKIDRGFDAPLLHTLRGVGYVIDAPG
ncbi:winged helix-turn-helix domain-containing protein [Phenylobacterium sp.]|uniref:winged helix-turn-helix domain-containing protein n=1 Tax=Phenylobacterium sp. TaxID=1871053 RepID=UPI00301D203A